MPQPVGVTGELCVGGIGLARGYLNQPELTREKFVSRSFHGSETERILRTGDLARFLPDGNVEFLGRSDHQVKIRGHRIEIGEVESLLVRHPKLGQAAVVALKEGELLPPGSGGGSTLAAFVVCKDEFDPELINAELQEYLGQHLPPYMLPGHFVILDALPRTATGKVDRQVLPLPLQEKRAYTPTHIAPRDHLEKELTTIWEQTLGIQPVGVTDNFFELGGHSLMAVRLFSKIEKSLGLQLPLLSLFDGPTIEQLAGFIRQQQTEQDFYRVINIQDKGVKPPFFCVSPSVIDAITYHNLSQHMGKDQPFYALYSSRLGEWNEGRAELSEVAAGFIARLREKRGQGPYILGGYSAGGVVALEMARLLRREGENVRLVILLDTFGPHFPELKPWVTPWLFNALRVLRRIQTYLWKFWILDWEGRLDYLRFRPIRTWLRSRYGELSRPPASKTIGDKFYLTPGRKNYVPEPYTGRVSLIRASKGMLGVREDPSMGWSETLTGEFEVIFVPGDHESILFGPRSQFVGQKLRSCIASASNRAPLRKDPGL
jgi:thioesterase domain-containing protein/acyl carrier protein